MKTSRFVCLSTVLAMCLGLACPAGARTIVVDGDPSDWIGLPPPMLNMGSLYRTATGQGEFYWLDAPADERTDFSAPDTNMDLLSVRVTADSTHLYLLLEFADTTPPVGPGAATALVGIDLDRVPGSGNTFLSAFSDTEVSPEVAWEYQIQTQLDMGLPTPAVLDASYTDVASPMSLTVPSPTAIEMAIAWSDLGLAGPPPTLAMTIGVCQGDGTGLCSDLGGVSDVLDAVTNYSQLAGMGNTWTEVADGFIDHHFELWFEPDGDPMPPVLINEVYYDTAGTDSLEEFVELVDMTGAGLDVGGYFVSDEETPGGGEGSMMLPPGAAFAGSVMVLALNEAGFQALFGSLPDYDTDAGSPTPDLIPQGIWSSGFATALSNGGDELLLFDRFGNLIDVVTYEGNTWPGVIDYPGVGTGFSFERCHPTVDGNDCAQEFFAQPNPSPGVLIACGAQGDACGDGNQCLSGFCVDGVCCESACDGACDATCNGASPGTCQPVDCSDGDVCTDDACNPAIGCVNTDNTASCDDGDACTTSDTCASGACVGGLPPNCDDGEICTDDSCDPATGCVNTPNANPCDDGDACTTADACAAGVCAGGPPLNCDDGELCTDDSCDPALGCVHASNADPCDDGNACTENDTCSGGTCVAGTPVGCDDGNPCTDDTCDPALGCVHTTNTDACNDGDACTLNDVCAAGVCVGGAPRDCDDADVCTDDSCDPATGCVNVNNVAPCDDGNACTTGDTCAAGSCVGGAPPDCDDGNLCTDDACNPASGCVYSDNTAACDDGDACTTADACAGGSCIGGAALDCDDGNLCTNDSCDPASGCTHANNSVPCDDGDACTTSDICSGGSCAGGAALDCDDANPCTDDTCDPASGCAYADNSADCDDGDACTAGDTCVGGACAPGPGLPCDDENPCTDDACDPATGCTFVDNTAVCDDGDACTMDDTCANGACGGVPQDADGDGYVDGACPGGNDCDDAQAAVNPGVLEAAFGEPMCADSVDNDCDGATDADDSGCQQCAQDADCADANLCNGTEACVAGLCQAGPALDCDDGNLCTNDSCDPDSGCTHANNSVPCDDGDACTMSDICSGGSCAGGAALDCDDVNPCTDDTCDPASGCAYADNSAACDDGDACTAGDTCVGGACVPGPGLPCDDENPCTDDACNPATGCTFVDNTAACDDGDACTVDDVCAGGSCSAGTAVDCDDANPCTDDTCEPAAGCVYADNTAACDDGDACTEGDACLVGACAGSPVDCGHLDGDCVEGVCDPASGGCVAQPLEDGTACDDGVECTVEDSCQDGVCAAGYDTCTTTGGCGCSAGAAGHPAVPATGLLMLLGFMLWRRRD